MGVEKAWTLSNTGAEACPSSQGVGSEAHEKEQEAGWGEASLLLSAGYSSGRCIPGTSFCSFWNPGLGLP